jgi:hypothetical protein
MIDVLFADEFETWWSSLTAEEQESIAHDVNILREQGVNLGVPRCSGITRSECYMRSTPIAQPSC